MTAHFLRKRIIETARKEAGPNDVFAKMAGAMENGKTTRKGYEKLLEYFRVSAPAAGQQGKSYFNEDGIKYLSKPGELSPCPHWCGIFALYVLKTAGMNVGNWIMSKGISSVSGIRTVSKNSAEPGDIGYLNNGFEHHVVIIDVFEKGGVKKVKTIEGNSAPNSNFTIDGERDLASLAATYTAFSS